MISCWVLTLRLCLHLSLTMTGRTASWQSSQSLAQAQCLRASEPWQACSDRCAGLCMDSAECGNRVGCNCRRQSAFVLVWALVVSALHCTRREGNCYSSRHDSDSPDSRPFSISEALGRADRSRTVFIFLHVVRAADVLYSHEPLHLLR